MLREVAVAVERGLWFLDVPVIRTFIVLFVMAYAVVIAPTVPPRVNRLFGNSVFKAAFFVLVVLLAHKDPQLALLVGLGFVFTVQALRGGNIARRLSGGRGVQPHGASLGLQTVDAQEHPDNQPRWDEHVASSVPIVRERSAQPARLVEDPDETEVGLPAYDDVPHSFAQGLGEPLRGYEGDDVLARV